MKRKDVPRSPMWLITETLYYMGPSFSHEGAPDESVSIEGKGRTTFFVRLPKWAAE